MRVSRALTRQRWRKASLRVASGSPGSLRPSIVPSGAMTWSRSSSPILSAPPARRALPNHTLDEELAGPVRRPDKGPGGDVHEAHRLPRLPVLVERLRRDVLRDGQMPGARPQVLAEGEDVDPVLPEVRHRTEDLLPRLPEAEHDRGFREEPRAHRLRGAEDGQALVVHRAGVPGEGLEPPDGLEVVVEDVGSRVDDGPDCVEVAPEVGDEGLHEDSGVPRLDLPDRPGEVVRAAVGQVVAVHGRQDHVGEAELFDRDGDLPRLLRVHDASRVPRGHGTESATARAHVPEEHDRRGAPAPALRDVRAVGLLADCVEVQAPQEGLEVDVRLPSRRAYTDPLGLPLREHATQTKGRGPYLV